VLDICGVYLALFYLHLQILIQEKLIIINSMSIQNISETEFATRKDRPTKVLDEEEYKRELNYVTEKAKLLVSQLIEMPFSIGTVKSFYKDFVHKASMDFNKIVRPNCSNSKKSYDFLRKKFQYEQASAPSFDEEIDRPIFIKEDEGRYIGFDLTERIRLSTDFFYFRVVIDLSPKQFDENINKKDINVFIYDRANSDLIDFVYPDGISIWLDKGITQYSYMKKIVLKTLNNEDYSDVLEECYKFFDKRKTNYRISNINKYYSSKLNLNDRQ
jgi:hypothetical protein